MLGQIIIGGILVAAGFYLVWKTRDFIGFFGSIPWADAKLGGGGTTLVYKTIGITVCLVGFLWMTGLWEPFLQATLGSLFGPRI